MWQLAEYCITSIVVALWSKRVPWNEPIWLATKHMLVKFIWCASELLFPVDILIDCLVFFCIFLIVVFVSWLLSLRHCSISIGSSTTVSVYSWQHNPLIYLHIYTIHIYYSTHLPYPSFLLPMSNYIFILLHEVKYLSCFSLFVGLFLSCWPWCKHLLNCEVGEHRLVSLHPCQYLRW